MISFTGIRTDWAGSNEKTTRYRIGDKMDNRTGLGDLIKEYHIHLHNVPLDINSMKDWDKDEKFLREKLNYFVNINEKIFNHNFNRYLKIKRGE